MVPCTNADRNQIADLKVSRGEIEYRGCVRGLLASLRYRRRGVRRERFAGSQTLLRFPQLLFGLLLHFTLGGWRQLGTAAAAGLCCGLIFLLFHLAGGMGGGDVKLITAVGCIAGLSLIQPLLILTSLAGGVMAIGLALYHRRLKETML